MAEENPTDSTQEQKPDAKPSPRQGARRPRPSPEGLEIVHPEGDEPETDSTSSNSEKVEEPHGAREKVTATHRAGPTPVEVKETKRTPPTVDEQSKTASLAERMRFSRRIKPRR